MIFIIVPIKVHNIECMKKFNNHKEILNILYTDYV